MRRLVPALLLGAAALTIGCSDIQVHTDYDTEASFAGYRSFDWVETHVTLAPDARTAQLHNDLLDKRIRRAVDTELGNQGLTRDTENPDVWVAYHVGAQDKIDVADWGYSYSGHYWGWARDVDVYSYTQGTLIVDLIDARTKSLVWRGTAQKTLSENPTPEKTEATVNKAVQKMFEHYPPQ